MIRLLAARRIALTFIVACVAIAFLVPASPAASQTPATHTRRADKPTIVLVHGAFEDGTSWQQVVAGLQRRQYDVIAVQMPLTSLGADVEVTKRVIDAQAGPVVVVGHSWGGAVITDAAADNARVKALVYIAAFAPDAREVVGAYNDKYPSRFGSALKVDAAGYLTVDPAQFHELFAKDVPVNQVRIAAATQKPIISTAFGEAVSRAAWRSIPSWYLVTLEDQAIHPDLQRFYAERMKAKTIEVKSSHAVIASHADDVVRLIEDAARSLRSVSQK